MGTVSVVVVPSLLIIAKLPSILSILFFILFSPLPNSRSFCRLMPTPLSCISISSVPGTTVTFIHTSFALECFTILLSDSLTHKKTFLLFSPLISTADPNSFARFTLKVRDPRILQDLEEAPWFSPDLKRDDFTLLEDSKPQKISSFNYAANLPISAGVFISAGIASQLLSGET